MGKSWRASEPLRLNQGVSDVRESWLMDPDTWADIERKDTAKAGRYYLGIDLGENASMSCAAAYWPDTGALAAIGVFPEQPDLLTRGHNDGCGELYVRAEARGELYQAGELVRRPCGAATAGPGAVGSTRKDSLRHLEAGQAQRDTRQRRVSADPD